MPDSPTDQSIQNDQTAHSDNAISTPTPARYFERPDPGEKPIGFLRLIVILISSHIGVRSRANREEDFRRANGLHVFIAGIIYFLIVISGLILVVNLVIG